MFVFCLWVTATSYFVVVPVSQLRLVWTHFVVVVVDPKVDQRFEQERKKKESLERLLL